MKKLDMRFSGELCGSFVGKTLKLYSPRPSSVSLYIGTEFYLLENRQESVDYFGYRDDIAIFRLSRAEEVGDDAITEVKSVIKGVKLINECQKLLKNDVSQYEVYLTRAIIFSLENEELMFEKDTLAFSEKIFIHRGANLASEVSQETFTIGWAPPDLPLCLRETIELKAEKTIS